MEILRGRNLEKPYRLLIYGCAGVGKSTLANTATKPIFLDVEDGISQLDADKTNQIKSIKDLTDSITWLINNTGEYSTVIIDTIDAFDAVIANELCTKNSKESLSDFSYGQGYDLLNQKWRKIITGLDMLVAKGYNVILLAHHQIKRYEDPTSEGWDKILLRMHTKPAATLMGWVDSMWYYDFERMFSNAKSGEKKKVLATGSRILHTRNKASFDAKCRYGTPEKIEVNEKFNLSFFEEKIRS
jgi:hypothetical protein